MIGKRRDASFAGEGEVARWERRCATAHSGQKLAQLITIKSGPAFKEALPLLSAADTIGRLLAKLDEKYLRFQSFQAPEKIIEAYRLIGHESIFVAVSDLWPGPNTTAELIKRRLSGYVQRRNQIAHEGDRELGGAART